MGGKPRKEPQKKPLTYGDLISGFDRIDMRKDFWEVTRRLHPGHATKEFKMAITGVSYQFLPRKSKHGGRHRMTLVVEYIDDIDEGYNE